MLIFAVNIKFVETTIAVDISEKNNTDGGTNGQPVRWNMVNKFSMIVFYFRTNDIFNGSAICRDVNLALFQALLKTIPRIKLGGAVLETMN